MLFNIVTVCRDKEYRVCRTEPPHPKAGPSGYYYHHRVVLENKLGRLLLDDEDCHHIDGDKSNDSPENLQAISHSDHMKLHHPKLEMVAFNCPCGNWFSVTQHHARWRIRRAKSGVIYCSRPCGGKYGAEMRMTA